MSLLDDFVSQPIPRRKSTDYDLALGSVLTSAKGYTYNFDSPAQASFYQGKTVVSRVILVAPAYRKEFYNTQTKKIDYATIPSSQIVLNTILVDITQQKNIITTEINGRNGTVKEYISDGDYELSFRGSLVNHVTDEMPVEEAKLLVKILSAEVPLQIISDYINTVYNINNIVIRSKNFPQEEGMSNTQLFEFTALSDEPIELQRKIK